MFVVNPPDGMLSDGAEHSVPVSTAVAGHPSPWSLGEGHVLGAFEG
jgi:hypothetical protein